MMEGTKYITHITFMFKQIYSSYLSTIMNKIDKPFFPLCVDCGAGSQTSVWINEKGKSIFLLLKGNTTR